MNKLIHTNVTNTITKRKLHQYTQNLHSPQKHMGDTMPFKFVVLQVATSLGSSQITSY